MLLKGEFVSHLSLWILVVLSSVVRADNDAVRLKFCLSDENGKSYCREYNVPEEDVSKDDELLLPKDEDFEKQNSSSYRSYRDDRVLDYRDVFVSQRPGITLRGSSGPIPHQGPFSHVHGPKDVLQSYPEVLYGTLLRNHNESIERHLQTMQKSLEKQIALPNLSRSEKDFGNNTIEQITAYLDRVKSGKETSFAPYSGEALKYVSRIEAAGKTYNPFSLSREISETLTAIGKTTQRSLGDELRRALVGDLIDRSGQLKGLPSAPRIVGLGSNRFSAFGTHLRRTTNEIRAELQILAGEFQTYCSVNGEAACDQLRPRYIKVRGQFLDALALLTVIDRSEASGVTPELQEALSSVDRVSRLGQHFLLGVFRGADSLRDVVTTLANNPGIIQRQLFATMAVVVFSDSFSRMRLAWSWVEKESAKIVNASVEDWAELAGRFAFDTASSIAGTRAITLSGELFKNTGRFVMASKALTKTIHAAADAGELSAQAAARAKGMAQVLPETTRALWRDRAKLNGLKDLPEPSMLSKVVRTEVQASDSTFAEWAAKDSARAHEMLNRFGPDLATSLHDLEGRLPGVLKGVKDTETLKSLGKVERILQRASRLSGAPPPTETVRNLIDVIGRLHSRGNGPLNQRALDLMAERAGFSRVILGNARRAAFTTTEIVAMYDNFVRLESALARIEGLALRDREFGVWRGVPRRYVEGAALAGRLEEALFELSPRNRMSSHRFSGPNREALYGTIGDRTIAERVITEELGERSSDLYFGQRQMRGRKVLDLTNPEVRSALGLNDGLINSRSYEFFQILGEAVRVHGYDSLLYFSARVDQTPGAAAINIVFFR